MLNLILEGLATFWGLCLVLVTLVAEDLLVTLTLILTLTVKVFLNVTLIPLSLLKGIFLGSYEIFWNDRRKFRDFF